MLAWFLAVPLIGKLWVIYVASATLLLGLATYIDLTKWSKVDGAGGWLIFAAMILSIWGLVGAVTLSIVIWVVQRVW